MPGRFFGRIQPAVAPHLRSQTYQLHQSLALLKPPPAKCDWYSAVKVPWGVQLNDTIGDCGVADPAHQQLLWSSNTNKTPVVVPDSVTGSVYSAISGWNPLIPSSDTGIVLSDMNSFWKNKGFYGNKIIGSGAVNPKYLNNVKWATLIFGGSTMGFSIPQSALDQNDAGKTWTVVKGSPIVGDHDVLLVGWDDIEGVFVAVTWGGLQMISYDFYSYYTDEAWARGDVMWIDDATSVAPSGLRIASIVTDMLLLS